MLQPSKYQLFGFAPCRPYLAGINMNKNNDNALIVFVKAPRRGRVKTRLQPELTADHALHFYKAVVEDLVAQLRGAVYCNAKIFFTPPDAHNEITDWLGDQFSYFPQQGNTLGDRMFNAMQKIFQQNYKKVVLVAGDLPTLDSTTIVRAFSALNDYDVVLGPAHDGGYYLIGSTKPSRELFQNIAWETPLVFQQTIRNAQNADLNIVQLEIKSNATTYEDVMRLWTYLEQRNRNGIYSYKPLTYKVLKKLFDRRYAPA